MDIDFEALTQVFLAEADDGLARMEEHVLGLVDEPDDRRRVDEVFRFVHTLKGDAGSLGIEALARFAHRVEDALDELREHRGAVAAAAAELLLRVVDRLRQMLADLAAGRAVEAPPDGEILVAQLLEAVRRPGAVLDGEAGMPLPGSAASPRPAGGAAPLGAVATASTLRVDLARLDQLLDLTGEIGVARGRLEGMLLEGGSPAAALELHRDQDRLFAELQELVMRLRMVPVGPTFRRFRRTVHDLARAAGRQVRLELMGEDVEVDARVIEKLRDPLLHLVRNAVDHGLERPEERRRSGKDGTGVLTLAASHEAGHVRIEVADDGRGLDRGRIRERARELGRLPSAAAEPGDDDATLDALILEPGFSTARSVTDLSGRGVGLDVVRRNVESLRGTLGITSRAGAGCRFSIRLPLTLAVIEGLRVRVGGDAYILPQESVEEILQLPAAEEARGRAEGLLPLPGGALPFHRLDRLLDLAETAGGASRGPAVGAPLPVTRRRRESVVVVAYEGRRAGLVVDAIEGQGQTVVRRLVAPVARVPGLAGSAILGDGRVALILDVPGLLRGSGAGPFPTPSPWPAPRRAAKEAS